MTTPKHAIDRNGTRYYQFNDTGPLEYLSVTAAISRGKPKNLSNWLRKTTAQWAVNNTNQWANLPADDAVELIAKQANVQRDQAAHRGDLAHQWLEHRLTRRTPDRTLYTSASRLYIDAVERFIGEQAPAAVHVEITVRNRTHQYAGSLDAIVALPGLPGLTLLDAKTSTGVYDETALQLAAYRNAEQYVDVNGNWHPMPQVDHTAVLWLRPGCESCDTMAGNLETELDACGRCGGPLEGRYQIVPVNADQTAWEAFQAVLTVAEWSTKAWANFRQPPIQPPRDLNAERRVNLTERITNLPDSAKQALAGIWPTGVPTLRQTPRHSAYQLDLIDQAVAHVEADIGAPFNPPPLPAQAGSIAHTAGAADVEQPAPQTVADAIIARLKRLPADLQAAIQANLAGRVPNLATGQATWTHLHAVDRELEAAETEHRQRVNRLTEALEPLGDDLVEAICQTVGCDTNPDPHTHQQAVQVLAIADDRCLGRIVTAAVDNDGTMVLGLVDNTLDLLVEQHGGKSHLLEAAKQLNIEHRLGLSFRSSAQAVADLRLAALLAAAG